jgi:DHA1 family tetracycline resistance protein-like MFS transporter
MPSIESVKQAPASGTATSHASKLVLFLTVFIDLLGFGIVIPFLPLYAERLGVGAIGIGLVLSIYSLMQLLCAPVLGALSDRIGRRPIILLGLLGSALGYLIYGFASSFATLLAARAVHGMFAATISTAQAYIADTTDESNRARGMGMIGAAFGLGFVLGPAIGGVLGRASLAVPVFFACALTFANFLFAAVILPESHQTASGASGLRIRETLRLPAFVGAFSNGRLRLLFAIAFMQTLALAGLEATFAMMVPRVYGYSALGVGLLLAYAGVIQAAAQGSLVGRLVPRMGERSVLGLGLGLLALGLPPIGSFSSHAALLVALAMVSLGYGLGSPAIASLITLNAERGHEGGALGLNQSALSLARIGGPIVGGILYQVFTPAAPYLGGALIVGLALLMTRGIATVPRIIEEH